MCSVGVYFSANDAVYDWSIAFLNSFRASNPNLRLLLIPFNDECDRLLKLKHTYNFEIYTDPFFERLETIGESFELGHTTTGPYWFRRYAAFWGPCDRFMYLDARQVVLADLMPIIQALDSYDFDLLHFDCAINQVYEPGELRRKLLSLGKARGFLSGLWAAKKGLFSIEEFERLAVAALTVRDQLNPRNTDQAFINYCCDTKPVCYGHISEVLGDVCSSSWARQPGKVYAKSNEHRLWDYGGIDHKKRLILMHWAGYSLNSLMPNYSLFSKFLHINEPSLIRGLYKSSARLTDIPIRAFLALRKNRWISEFYHS